MVIKKLLGALAASGILCFSMQAQASSSTEELQRTIRQALTADRTASSPFGIVSKLFLELDRLNDGIDQYDIDLAVRMRQAQVRSFLLAALLRYDLDGDSAVTRDEIRLVMEVEQRQATSGEIRAGTKRILKLRREAELKRMLAWDRDGDGRVEPEEYVGLEPKTSKRLRLDASAARIELAKLLLAHDPSSDSKLQKIEAYAIVTKALEGMDLGKLRLSKTSPTSEPAAACKAPAASPAARVVLVGAHRGSGVSSVAVAGEDVITNTAEINIEPGEEPLYVLLTTFNVMAWRFTGAVDRVERVVVGGVGDRKKDAVVAGGVLGVPAHRVTFAQTRDCLPNFHKPGSISAAKAEASAKVLAGKKVNTSFGKYRLHKLNLPSAQMVRAKHDKGLKRLKLSGDATAYGPAVQAIAGTIASDPKWKFEATWRRFLKRNPGGIVAIAPDTLVASRPAETYKLLPHVAGLLQLMATGAVKHIHFDEYEVTRKMRYPIALSGPYKVKFLLKPGMPIPDGDAEQSCVFSVEQGKFLSGTHC